MKKFFLISFSILSALFLTGLLGYCITMNYIKQSEAKQEYSKSNKKPTISAKDILSNRELNTRDSLMGVEKKKSEENNQGDYTDKFVDFKDKTKSDGAITNDGTENSMDNFKDYKENIYNNHDTEVFTPKPTPPKGYTELNSIQERDFYVYGKLTEGDNYDRIALNYKGKLKYFSWTSNKKEASIYINDFNSDNKEEAVIVLNRTSGTGIYESTIHVISLNSLMEIKVEDLNEIIKKNTRFELKSDRIVLKLKGVPYDIPITQSYTNLKDVYKSIGIGSYSLYYAEDEKIQCTASVQSLPDGYHGDVIITYKFKNGQFFADTLEYEPQADENNEINENWPKLFQL